MKMLQATFLGLLLLPLVALADTQLFSNNATTTLATSVAAADTTIAVTDGSSFQSPGAGEYELATIYDGTNREIVKITGHPSTNIFNITRSQEGTTAPATFAAGTRISANLTAGSLDKFRDEPGADATGDLVFQEKADHSSTPAAGYGYVWTKNTTPSTLIFTDDAGTDITVNSGDVAKVGTPVDDQVGVWTGDGTIEGDTALTFDTSTDTLTSVIFAGSLSGTLGADLDANSYDIQFDDATGIRDDSDNETLIFSSTGSAVNYATLANAATGNGPVLQAAGETNVPISILGKGTGDITLGTLVFDGDQTVGAGQDNYVLTYDNGGGTIQLEVASGGLSDVVDDTTPQLGGDLDVNGHSIVSVSAGDIAITPDTTGDVILDGLKWPQADGSADQVLKTDGAGQTSWVDQPSGTAADIDQYDVACRLAAGTGAYVGCAAGDLTEEASPAAGDYVLAWESGGALRKIDYGNFAGGLPQGYIDGLITSRASATSISVAAGEARDDTDAVDMVLASALTKTEASWSVGTAAGGLDGSESSAGNYDNETWYYIYLIKRSDTGVVDVLFSESKTTPTLPTNYDYSRLIGAFFHDTGGSTDILDYYQNGDHWYWVQRGGDGTASYGTTTDGYDTTWTSRVMAVPPISGIEALITFGVNNSAAAEQGFGWQHGGLADGSANYYELAGYIKTGSVSTDVATGKAAVMVDGAGQIKIKLSGSSGFTAFASVHGWIFSRGKN
jgi:hypothetical protein